jgi:hypothetical protein
MDVFKECIGGKRHPVSASPPHQPTDAVKNRGDLNRDKKYDFQNMVILPFSGLTTLPGQVPRGFIDRH